MERDDAPVNDILAEVPASVGQRLLWLMNRRRGSSGALNERLVWRIRGPLDTDALAHALDGLTARHEGLRTTFAGRGRGLVQQVHAPRAMALRREPLRDVDGALDAAIDAEGRVEIDPGHGPVRARLWGLSDDEHVLFVSVHHLVTDQASNAIIARDIAALFEHAVGGGPPLDPVGWQYRDWSERQRARLETELDGLQAFWRRQLAGARFVDLPPRSGASAGLDDRAYERRTLGPAVAAASRALADRHETTIFALMLAAFFTHLHGVTGRDDLALATLFANRDARTSGTVGFFVNMLVLRARVDPDMTFTDLLLATSATIDDCGRHRELPYQMLAPDTIRAQPGGGVGRADDVVFQCVEGDPRPTAQARIAGLQLDPVEREWRRSRFALELFVAHAQDAVTPIVVYDTGRFDLQWARTFADGYAATVAAIAADPQVSVRELVAHGPHHATFAPGVLSAAARDGGRGT